MDRIPDIVKPQIKLSIDNIRYLMFNVLDNCPKEHWQRVYDVFKRKIKGCFYILLNWYNVYNKSIPDGMLMLIEQEIKVNRLKDHNRNRIQILNYNINQEIYYFMNRIYNLYPNR